MPTRTLCCIILLAMVLVAIPTTAAELPPSLPIRLQRATFDPLHNLPALARSSGDAQTSLRIVQFNAPPDAQTEAQLRAAGMTPLGYIPENAYLVRTGGTARTTVALGERWSGPVLPAYKLAPALGAALDSTATAALTLVATPDRDVAALVAAVVAAGGRVISQHRDVFAPSLQVEISLAALPTLLQRDDLLWVERAATLRPLNDKGRQIMRVDMARAQIPGLTGKGQIIAVADTGLDIQANVLAGANPDFAPERIAAATNICDGETDWSDYIGHGTHVAGTILGSGAASPGQQFAGIAPEALLVVQSLVPAPLSASTPSRDFCSFDKTELLANAYAQGARILNASWGGQLYGGYDATASEIDGFIAKPAGRDLLVVVAAGNEGSDATGDGIIDRDSIDSPGTAKNVLTVGASENDRPQESKTWAAFFASNPLGEPIRSDHVSDNPDGIAAFSSRGPTDDGRLKPDMVAPGTSVISAVSHTSSSEYEGFYAGAGLNYGYLSGTSMAAPMVSGAAALVRQWLAEQRGLPTPSAALVKALLLNGATNTTPGQYGNGAFREIPAAWPNNVEGWGRANLAAAIGLGDTLLVQDYAENGGLRATETQRYTVQLAARQTLRTTLAWSDPPPLAIVFKKLVNNLDLELLDPQGNLVARGNERAELPVTCSAGGADTCNNVEALEFTAPTSGDYTLRVRGTAIPRGPQPFALVAGSPAPTLAPDGLQAANPDGTPLIRLTWNTLAGASSYEVRFRATNAPEASAQTIISDAPVFTAAGATGSYSLQVRGCNANGCGPFSPIASATVTTPPKQVLLPLVAR